MPVTSVTYGEDSSPPSRGFPDETPPQLLPVLRLSRAARTGNRDMSNQPKSTFARRVRAARPRDKRLEVRDDPVQGLMLRIFPSGARTFAFEGTVRGRRRYRMKPLERFLTAEEMARLNAVLTRDDFWCPHVVAIVRLLTLTGCRFGEIVSLEWDWIRGKRIHLPDSKSGPRTVWLSSTARAVIDAIPR